MSVEDGQTQGDGRGQAWPLRAEDGPGVAGGQEYVSEIEYDHRGHAGDAEVSSGFENQRPGSHGDQGGDSQVRPDAQAYAGAGGDAFAAFEIEEDAEHMAEHGGSADEDPEETGLPVGD